MKNSSLGQIVFLGESTFPAGLAAVQRMTLMAKSLLGAGYAVTVVCRKGGSRSKQQADFPAAGSFEGIDYIYTSGEVLRPAKFLRRTLMKIKGMWREFLYLRRLKRENGLVAAVISNHSTIHLMRYRLYAWLIDFPIILNFVEMASVMQSRRRFLVKLNDYFFDRYIVKIVDGALPISEFLMDYYKKIAPGKPQAKLPILCDFDKFQYRDRINSDTILLYCGAASYFELVDFVVSAFDTLEGIDDTVYLDLILGGKESELNKIESRLQTARHKDRIRLITNVPHKDIPGYYARASALLIPLRPTPQDAARFPHKIGEYLASGRPMITTHYGEIQHYNFVDGENALIADDYDIASFTDKMGFIVSYPERADSIGVKGRKLGLENFDYASHSERLKAFFGRFNQA